MKNLYTSPSENTLEVYRGIITSQTDTVNEKRDLGKKGKK